MPLLYDSYIYPLILHRKAFSLRNLDYPNTFIKEIRIDITSPNHNVYLAWEGTLAEDQEAGPFKSSPGRGLGYNDCNDPVESNCVGSNCTPIGEHLVEGFSLTFRGSSSLNYLTYIDFKRAIAIHAHQEIPDYPASGGCVRLAEHPAKLIHNNSIEGSTKVIVSGKWTPGGGERYGN